MADPGPTRPVTRTTASTPSANDGRVQVTTWPAMVQLPPCMVAAVGVTPVDRVSVTTTWAAVFGPLLVTVITEVALDPAASGSGVVVLVTWRSALTATGV